MELRDARVGSEPGLEERRAQLLAACSALAEPDRQVLAFLSAWFIEPEVAWLPERASRAGLRTDRGSKYRHDTWESAIGRLRAAGLLEEKEAGRTRCHRLIADVLTRRAAAAGQLQRWTKVIVAAGVRSGGYYANEDQLLQAARLCLYGGKADQIPALLRQAWLPAGERVDRGRVWVRMLCNPFDAQLMRTLPRAVLLEGLAALVEDAHVNLTPAAELMGLCDEVCGRPRPGPGLETLQALRAEHRVLTGRLDQARAMVERRRDSAGLAVAGWLCVLAGDDQGARPLFHRGLTILRQEEGRPKVYFCRDSGIYCILSLLRTGTPAALAHADKLLGDAVDDRGGAHQAVYRALRRVAAALLGRFDETGGEIASWQDAQVHGADQRFVALAHHWLDAHGARAWLARLAQQERRADGAGYRLVAAELALLRGRLGGADGQADPAAAAGRELGGWNPVDAVDGAACCRGVLRALAATASGRAAAVPRERLVWLVSDADPETPTIEPRVQKIGRNGAWSAGRAVSPSRLFQERGRMDFLTAQDERVCQCLETVGPMRGTGVNARFRVDRALQKLVGHPQVFLFEDRDVQVELVGGEPELLVTPQDGDLLVQLSPAIAPKGPETVLVREGQARFRVIAVTEEHRRMTVLLGAAGLRVPGALEAEAMAAVEAVSGLVTVQSGVGAATGEAAPTQAEPRPHVQLVPYGEGLAATLRVYPLGVEGPAVDPGEGGTTLLGRIDGRAVYTTRDLAREVELAEVVVQVLASHDGDGATAGGWHVPDPGDCLELLEALRELGDAVLVEWPQGERFRLRRAPGLSQWQLAVRRERNWFQLSATLRVDADLVLDMRRLLELARATRGRFMALGEGEFMALTEELRRRLAVLEALAEAHGDGARVHPLLTGMVEELAEGTAGLETDAAWREQVERLAQAQQLEPEVPEGLRATLRGYQVEGYRWLARLAHLGVGACLADDMGLGKTVQAMAVVLARAAAGPTLVVAPTSVGGNWVDEARRFAPALKPIQLRGEDREAVLCGTGPFDLVVCSYALLQRERQGLAAVDWQTVVLDEAQAIKNPQTLRSQAAMALRGDFRLITTGTPVENNLGELWNLFRFLNPGLLGSRARFNERFARPIERDGDGLARQHLQRLIRPFLLRRVKGEVLTSLPPCTEVTLRVQMGPDEAALYEALRQEAVADAAASRGPEGQRYVRILAQIMRLRRACCHPQLAVPEASTPSAKLGVFADLLTELREGGHRALVFSQFVDFLHIVRQQLDDAGIAYQYLDGSTPARHRQERVRDFQAGVGEVFLISLRAGGLGLNLTAADYVVHLDPWWNPAVEDQASDRAHRIGQQRPVTVYRLVTQGTIEERIVALHAEKRELADGVLAGAAATARLSAAELLELMQ